MSSTAEARGTTVEDATRRALAQLGRTRDEVVIEVLDEGRRGLFGGRKALVRVTERSVATPPRASTAGTDPAGSDGAHGDDEPQDEEEPVTDTGTKADQPEATTEEEVSPEERMDQLDEEADLAADFVEGLLDQLDLPGDIEIEVHEEQALVNVQDVGSGLLIGRRGATLDALQELVRCAVQRQTERRSHVRVDVEGYRARQLDKLRDKCRDAIAEVRETGEPVRLEPMDAYERKMMHDLVAKTGGVASASEGSEPKRRVVIRPDDS